MEKRNEALTTLVFILILTITAFCQAQADERGIMRRSGAPSLHGPKLRIILGSIESITNKSTDKSRNFTYVVSVLFECRGLLNEGNTIQFDIVEQGGSAGGAGRFPNLKIGHVYLLTAQSTPDRTKVVTLLGGQLPIGLLMLSEVVPQDVPLVKAALAKLGEVAQTDNSMLNRDEAQKLLQTKDNYYLWALGAAGLAAYGDKQAKDTLMFATQDGKTTIRQIVWLDHCFGSIFPEATHPSDADRHGVLLYYLQRLSVTDPDKAAPSPTTQEE